MSDTQLPVVPMTTSRRACLAVAMVAMVAAVAACSGSDGVSPSAGRTSTPTTTGVSTTPSAPASVIPQRRWMLDTVDVDYPDGLATIDGGVFVKTDDGRVARIDPETGTVVAEAKIDTARDASHYCLGIGSDGTTLWACTAGDKTTDVVRLDPKTLEVTKVVKVDKVFDQYALSIVDGKLWVLAGNGNRLTSVDTATGQKTTVPLGRRCFQLAATTTTVYATCQVTNEVIAVDAGTGDITSRVDVASPGNVSVSGDNVWVSGSAGLLHLDTGLQPRADYPGPAAGSEGDLVATDTAVWIRQPEGFLLRVDPTTGQVAARYDIDPVPSGGSLLVTDNAAWTSAFDDNTIYKIDPMPGP